MADPFLEQVKEWCGRYPLAAKWVLVPEPGLGWTLSERLLLEGCNWVNLHWVTPFELALEAVAPRLLAEGFHPCPEGLGPVLLQNLLLTLPTQPHFRPLALQPGMAEALWSTLCEFRLAGLSSSDLQRLPQTPKNLEWAALVSAYERCLEERRWLDRADILRSAGLPRRFQGDDRFLLFPYTAWAPLESAWMGQLPLELSPGPDLQPETRPEVFYARHRHHEIEEILWRMGEEGIGLDQVEMVALPEELPGLVERIQAVGFPCTVQAGWPLPSTRPGQAVMGLLDWVEEGFSAFRLRQLLLSELIQLPPNPAAAARILKSARIAWGRRGFADGFCQLRQAYLDREWLELAEECVQLGQALEVWLECLDPADKTSAQWLEGLAQVVGHGVLARSKGEERARERMVKLIGQLTQLPPGECQPDQWIQQVRQALSRQQALSERPQPGKIHLSRPTSLGLSGRPHVFWVGLEEGRWFGAEPQDCVLSDEERRLLHPELRLASDWPQTMELQMRERMATCAGRLTLSFSLLDARGENEQMPSWFFLEWAGADAQSWQQQVPEARPLRVTGQAWPGLERGRQATLARKGPLFTHYDGLVAGAAGVLDPRNTQKPLSVSWLQELATCPFRTFLQDGLALRGGELPTPNFDQWLDPATRGILLHQVLADYFLEEGSGIEHLRARLEFRLEELRRRMPPTSAALERVEVAELHRDLDWFLTLDEAQCRPLEVEMPFDFELEGLRFRGRIDRVDRVAEGYSVLDYKTGKNPAQLKVTGLDRGRHLQPALYALAVEQLLGKVESCAYTFVRADIAHPRRSFPPPSRERFQEVLELVLEPTRSGVFPHTHESRRDCSFCEVKAACRAHQDEPMAAKLVHPQNTLLESRRRLMEQA